jgi:amino acid transporter/nucleotide-binding universal stress UspA family protein
VARRKKREGQVLGDVLGTPDLFGSAYGTIGSSIYYALGVVAAAAMGLTPLAIVIAGLLFVTTAFSYAEATTMFPEAGGSASFARRTFNDFVSFGAGWALVLDFVAMIAISAFFVPTYLSTFWPSLKVWPYNSIGAAVVIAALVAVGVVGRKAATGLHVVLVILDIGTQVLLAIIGLILILSPKILLDQINVGVAPTWHQLVYGLAIATVAYTGIEVLSNIAERSTDPGREVPRVVKFALAALLGVYVAISLVGLSAATVHSNVLPVDSRTGVIRPVPVVPEAGKPAEIGPYVLRSDPAVKVFVRVDPATLLISPPVEGKQLHATGPIYRVDGRSVTELWGTQLGNVYEADPLQGIVQNLPDNLGWLKTVLSPWIALLAAAVLIVAANVGLTGVARLAFSMAGHRQLPLVFSRVHPTWSTAYVPIVFFGTVAAALAATGSIELMIDLYVFGAMSTFFVAHLCVVALRIKAPRAARPWRSPINLPFRDTGIPVLAVIGGLGTVAAWCVVVFTHKGNGLIGLAWMAVGLTAYVGYRTAKGYSLTKSVESMPLHASGAIDVDYDRILVPLIGSRVTDEMMVLACQLATEKKSSVDGLYVIEIALNLPLDARLTEERRRAERVMASASLVADSFQVKFTPHIVAVRQAGRAIVEQAVELRSEVIIIGVTRKRRIGNLVFGRTADYVLDNAPCEVLLNLVPKGYPIDGSSLADSLEQSDPGPSGAAVGGPVGSSANNSGD